jgi:hypothetical protein
MSFMGGMLLAGSAPAYYIGSQKTEDLVSLQPAPIFFPGAQQDFYVAENGVVQIASSTGLNPNSVRSWTPDGAFFSTFNFSGALSPVRQLHRGFGKSAVVYGTGAGKVLNVQNGDLNAAWGSALTGLFTDAFRNVCSLAFSATGRLFASSRTDLNDSAADFFYIDNFVTGAKTLINTGAGAGAVACSATKVVSYSPTAIRVSSDNGATWSAGTSDFSGDAVLALEFVPSVNRFIVVVGTVSASFSRTYIATSAGNDGLTWQSSINFIVPGGNSAATFTPARITDGGRGVIVTTEGPQDLGETTNKRNKVLRSEGGIIWYETNLSLPQNNLPICYA